MPGPRENFTATVLKNGKVLVAGTPSGTPGGPPGDPAKSALLYDPVKNAWDQTGPMITSRSLHSATLLADGRVLVAGGLGDAGFVNTAELYDPTTGKWSPAGSIGKGGRHWHTATLLKDGKVLVAGGRNQSHEVSYADAWLYDPKANGWTQTGSFEVARRSHSATLLNDGTVLITGGQVSGHDPSLKDAMIYDPVAGAFKPVPDLLDVGRAEHTASLLADGTVLLAGGTEKLVGGGIDSLHASTEIYDPKAQIFTPAGPLLAPRRGHTAVTMSGGKVVAEGGTGGGTAGNAKDEPIYTAESYDPTAKKWTAAGSLTPLATEEGDALPYGAAVLLDEKPCGQNCGKALVLGGTNAQLYGEGTLEEKGSPLTGSAEDKGKTEDKKLINQPAVWAAAGIVVLLAVWVVVRRRR